MIHLIRIPAPCGADGAAVPLCHTGTRAPGMSMAYKPQMKNSRMCLTAGLRAFSYRCRQGTINMLATVGDHMTHATTSLGDLWQ